MSTTKVSMKQPSPVESDRSDDPLIRAVNTFIYGVIVHFGSIIIISKSFGIQDIFAVAGATCFDHVDGKILWPTILLLHEYWVFLQHSNVFGNPLCQRLDRQYGIALLKSNQHWAIAGTLSAYWCREMISMFLCLPFLSTALTKYLVLYSLVYHTIKSRGIRKDAFRRHSSTFGIMRQVIDKFYHHTTTEQIITFVRLFLQGSDTLIHALIIKDLLASHEHVGLDRISMLHTLFYVWIAHAAMNQYFRCSTATLMVQAWNSLTSKVDDDVASVCDTSDEESSVNADSISNDGTVEDTDKFVVRSLLRPGRVSNKLKGHMGVASGGVNTAVRIETILSIIAAIHIVGLGDVPFRTLLAPSVSPFRNIASALTYSWLLLNIYYSASFVVFPKSSGKSSGRAARKLSLLNAVDVLVLVVGIYKSQVVFVANAVGISLAAALTAKSFVKASKWSSPKIFWIIVNSIEAVAKLLLCRWISKQHEDGHAAVGGIVSFIFFVHMAIGKENTAYSPSDKKSDVAEIVFLGHPAELSDCWALWLLPYSLSERWQRPWWAVPLWPLHYAVGYYTCNYRQKLFGDGASFFNCDHVQYETVTTQIWVATHFGRHFFTSKKAVRLNIEAAARHANDTGVKVLCLGALNKAEGINGGGVSVARALGPNRNVSVIHGNHLTAAAVVETTHQVFGDKAKVFLTGASSKVGWAVAQALKKRHGFDVLCHSTDKSRRDLFKEHGFTPASTLTEGASSTKYWIVGKYDQEVARIIPQGAVAIVFAVPHPLHDRKDVRVIEAGTLHADLNRLDRPRRFTNKLKEHEMFACHAAGIVAADRLKRGRCLNENGRVDEIGPVDPDTMDSWLEDAKLLGFSVPTVQPVDSSVTYAHDLARHLFSGVPPVVIIGAGPSGLATAASLRRRGVASLVFESQTDEAGFGSWDQHFSGLVVTSQKKWCNLPGFKMSDKEFSGETISGVEYRRYLKLYAKRFDLDIRRGCQVRKVEKGDDKCAWYVDVEHDGSTERYEASAVVDSSGKHRLPRRDTSDGLAAKLDECGIPYLHSSDLKSDDEWKRAITVARCGKLSIVGFGNSACDIASSILSQSGNCDRDSFRIHIAARTVPPVFPRCKGALRVDTIGFFVRVLPLPLQDIFNKILWWKIPDSAVCDASFPTHLPRWTKVDGRVPVIDKYGLIAGGFRSGKMVGHGPISGLQNEEGRAGVLFEDGSGGDNEPVDIDLVILATGYVSSCIVGREDELNGLYCVGFGNDRYLPLRSIGEQAVKVGEDIASRLVVR